MSYSKYFIYKEQISFDEGVTWLDTGQATPSGDPIGTYSTLGDCEGVVPPIPTNKKLVATYTGGTTNEVECNSSGTLTSGETKPSGYDYTSMKSAAIGDCVTSIGHSAFFFCMGLTSVAMSNNVTSISGSAFAMCIKLANINIPTGLTTIGEGAFQNCKRLKSVTIPNSVTSISNGAFSDCGLTSVTIPNSVTYIADTTFLDCYSLTSVTIPNSVTHIGSNAFAFCSSLKSVTIPNSVTYIGQSAFRGCVALTSITVNATTPPRLWSLGDDRVFDDTNNCPIYVPASSVNVYKATTNWRRYASRIQPIP